jgi:hypothetical protein
MDRFEQLKTIPINAFTTEDIDILADKRVINGV